MPLNFYMGLWSYYFWAMRRGQTCRSAIAIPMPFEPKQERICLAPKAFGAAFSARPVAGESVQWRTRAI